MPVLIWFKITSKYTHAHRIQHEPGYHAHKNVNDELQMMMKEQFKNLRQAKLLSTEESSSLNKPTTLKSMIRQFIKHESSEYKAYKDAIKKSEENLTALWDSIPRHRNP